MSRFRTASQLALSTAAPFFIERRFFKGETLVDQETSVSAFLILETGYLKWERHRLQGPSSLLDVYGPCESPGELALRHEANFPATGIALTDGILLSLHKRHYLELLRDPSFSDKTARCKSNQALSLMGRVEAASIPEVGNRLEAFIYRLCLKFGKTRGDRNLEIPFQLSGQDFASAANCRRETAARVLASWKKKNEMTREADSMVVSGAFFLKLESTFGSKDSYFGSECHRCQMRTVDERSPF